MRHRMRGRKLGRNASHRKAMFRNMAVSLIKTVRIDEEAENAPKVSGRITTTVQKAKELRPFIEKLITVAKKAQPHIENAAQYATSAEKNSSEWTGPFLISSPNLKPFFSRAEFHCRGWWEPGRSAARSAFDLESPVPEGLR